MDDFEIRLQLLLRYEPQPGECGIIRSKSIDRPAIQLPTEVWERVIDRLAEEYQYREYELWVYAQVCREWYPRCRFHARGSVVLDEKKQVYRLGEERRRRDAIRLVRIDEHVAVLGSFAACMARRLPHAETLVLRSLEWVPGELHRHVFMHVGATFQSVATLVLFEVGFPSVAVFGRLVCALPRLSSLMCWALDFRTSGFIAGSVRMPKRCALTRLVLGYSPDVVDLFVLTSIGTGLQRLALYDCDPEQRDAYQILLSTAGPSLSSIIIDLGAGVRDWKDLPLDFNSAVNLQTLCLNVDANGLVRHSAWLLAVLSATPRSKLSEIRVASYERIPGQTSLAELFRALDGLHCTQIDHLLSGSQSPALRAVVFEFLVPIHLEDIEKVPSEQVWREHLVSWFPKMHARGILR
ncbi:uncharacterized protein FIBRA_07539 [Fibroporia radiculosa]|uniref:F-box domain-containing protein n=1 Tax=Fibroporia radiculosa TaxID=599839 RepID=J4GV63_9APHY|nr:uncharacterized protein FIBRA_07539 [Fibroporia radiculosa]CCM05325.1 predicted protein [Fibroporia radiculosa]